MMAIHVWVGTLEFHCTISEISKERTNEFSESRESYEYLNVDTFGAFFLSCSFIMLMTCFIHVRE